MLRKVKGKYANDTTVDKKTKEATNVPAEVDASAGLSSKKGSVY